jgi:hypothetical protein
MAKSMKEFHKGTLKSSSGKKVISAAQAKAIGHSQDEKKHGKGYKKGKK